jgi:hypothetical protein
VVGSAPSRGSNSYVTLGPRSGIIVRVPLSADGQCRKVAVLYEAPATTPGLWGTGVGFLVFRMLPQSLKTRLLQPRPALHRAWCEHELSYPVGRLSQK